MKKSQLKQIVKEEIKNVLKEDINSDVKKDYAAYTAKKKVLLTALKYYKQEIAKLDDAHLGDFEELYDRFIDFDNEVNDLIKTYGYGN